MELEDSSSSVSSSSNELSSSRPPATATKRKAGRRKFRETRHPVYRGVRQRNGLRWVCEVREPHKKTRLWLGTFPTPEMAARAHDVAAIALRGPSAPLNFPDSASTLQRPSSLSPDDIRTTAVKAAEMFRPNLSMPSVSGVAEGSDRGPEEAPLQVAEVFVDDEEMFNMPALVDDMAAGMMLTPPAMQRGFDWNGEEGYMDMSLWSE